MPIFNPITLDRFFEPDSHNLTEKLSVPVKVDQPIPHRNMSPALYATPQTAPLPPETPLSPSSFSPVSPYVINHKRRGPRLSSAENTLPDTNCGPRLPESSGKLVEEMKEKREVIERVREKVLETTRLEVVREDIDDAERGSEADEFFELHESLSITSEDGSGVDRSWQPDSSVGEFYDACEETMSEGSETFPSNRINNIEAELREIRLTLLMEMEKRKHAEQTLQVLQNQWIRLRHQLSLLGLSLPQPQLMKPEINENTENSSFESDPVEELCRQISISRLVTDAVSKGISRAEVVAEMESVLQSKNFEISRLMDRVQYYEAANREMSQRNQEAIEVARQQRNKRRIRQKWIWASVGLAVTLSSAAIAWSYLPSRSVPSEQKDTLSREK
ncbi:hypothetical protein LUZ62_021520 [Rhynchospora pubera]|uniref:Uncharacterized protein n=1 Tax=Rhynchospora pubera TaxID=906938 RepID=A0AAV8FCZ2_9POAL|nr:hypothetical protein LUZ62_066782 [Rhynchospora pubera]KAJ4789441.1 hypothetical protein LUZ62_040687 [Rhynchospora pubera]KAJ4808954.1 hypothetical protein LUZ62_021520 [Rhynchospora pubera]